MQKKISGSNLFGSLRLRLFVGLLVVVGIALAAMAIFASRITTSEFERSLTGILKYRDPRIESKISQIQKYITQHAGEQSTWEGLQELMESMQASSGLRLVLADLDGMVYADSSQKMLGNELNIKLSKPFAAFLIEGMPTLAYFEPIDAPNLGLIQERFTASVNRSLGLAILVAGLFTLLLTLVLSQGVLRPVSALTTAVRKIGQGDLNHRVDVRASGELNELAQAFNTMADGLARLEQLRHNMVTDVAHELRTPLSNIRGYLEAIQDGMLNPTPDVVALLHEEAMLLNRLVDDLQELAQVEAGQLHLNLQAVNLKDIVERTIIGLLPQTNAEQIQIKSAIPADLPPVNADPERVGQILRNLLDNALVYTPAGGVITITSRQVDGFLEIAVSDTGSGISSEHLPFIFERFYRVDKSRARTTGGAGLGLAIVKQLVEAQGGQVHAESILGEGTCMVFTLPTITSSEVSQPTQPKAHPIVTVMLESQSTAPTKSI